ncbi:hypothetical protein diail_2708 [Diaporthe ilicicola]|nr:hypothetical protein diail_2708 [Diaporthe ilicicola]
MIHGACAASRKKFVSVTLGILLFLAFYHVLSAAPPAQDRFGISWQILGSENGPQAALPESGPLPIPPEYQAISETVRTDGNPEYCTNGFSPKYLDDFRNHSIQYCSTGSSRLTCFHGTLVAEVGRDSFCIGQDAIFDSQRGNFAVDCQVRKPEKAESNRGIISLNAMGEHWYETGAPIVFDRFVDVGLGLIPGEHPGDDDINASTHSNYTVLVKREGNQNFWHNLMEIWSMTLTLDILRMSRENSSPDDTVAQTGRPLLTIPALAHNTQVVIGDDDPEGPLYELWALLSGSAPIRLSEIRAEPDKYQSLTTGLQNIIVPLPGASNPLWQNDWEDRDCTDSVNLKVFVERVKAHYRISPEKKSTWLKRKLELTFIERKGSRRLIDADQLLQALEKTYPNVSVKMVDFGALSIQEQLVLMQHTDILVGVHGAGLTHTMFMRSGQGAVVEIQPPDMGHKGFKNLAKMTGLDYFTAHGELVPADKKFKRDEWHFANVAIEESKFLELIDQAVKALLGDDDHHGQPPGIAE